MFSHSASTYWTSHKAREAVLLGNDCVPCLDDAWRSQYAQATCVQQHPPITRTRDPLKQKRWYSHFGEDKNEDESSCIFQGFSSVRPFSANTQPYSLFAIKFSAVTWRKITETKSSGKSDAFIRTDGVCTNPHRYNAVCLWLAVIKQDNHPVGRCHAVIMFFVPLLKGRNQS